MKFIFIYVYAFLPVLQRICNDHKRFIKKTWRGSEHAATHCPSQTTCISFEQVNSHLSTMATSSLKCPRHQLRRCQGCQSLKLGPWVQPCSVDRSGNLLRFELRFPSKSRKQRTLNRRKLRPPKKPREKLPGRLLGSDSLLPLQMTRIIQSRHLLVSLSSAHRQARQP